MPVVHGERAQHLTVVSEHAGGLFGGLSSHRVGFHSHRIKGFTFGQAGFEVSGLGGELLRGLQFSSLVGCSIDGVQLSFERLELVPHDEITYTGASGLREFGQGKAFGGSFLGGTRFVKLGQEAGAVLRGRVWGRSFSLGGRYLGLLRLALCGGFVVLDDRRKRALGLKNIGRFFLLLNSWSRCNGVPFDDSVS